MSILKECTECHYPEMNDKVQPLAERNDICSKDCVRSVSFNCTL